MENDKLTELEKANLKVKCAEMAIANGTKVGLERDACLGAAEKIYKFVTGTTEKSAPEGEHK